MISLRALCVLSHLLIVSCGGGSSGTNDIESPLGHETETDNTSIIIPDESSTEQDTDGDMLPDSVDIDDDNDGFLDDDDPDPLNQSIPGDFSTPQTILGNPIVQSALAQAAAQGFSIETIETENPPLIDGYYIEPENSTVFVATDNGDSIGDTRNGAEFRYDQLDNNTINGAVVNVRQSSPTSYSLSSNALLRGTGNRFTRYSRSRVTCTVDGSNFSVLFVGISTAQLEFSTGDFMDRERISISVATFGEPTQVCNQLIAGGAEVVGGWSASIGPRVRRVQTSELQFMCVDEENAYAPTEVWTSSNGSSCSCTTEYTTSCQ